MRPNEMFISYFIEYQNGYGARRRSIVDDARFETLVNKQTRESLANEVGRLSRGNGARYESLTQQFQSILNLLNLKSVANEYLIITWMMCSEINAWPFCCGRGFRVGGGGFRG